MRILKPRLVILLLFITGCSTSPVDPAHLSGHFFKYEVAVDSQTAYHRILDRAKACYFLTFYQYDGNYNKGVGLVTISEKRRSKNDPMLRVHIRPRGLSSIITSYYHPEWKQQALMTHRWAAATNNACQ
ncbi:MAG: hypothetical protein HUJ30_04720 [Gammaproteobacteria bacterium]|nr:hypothetical protein [Gammaproteobacteria bacterium]